MLIKLFPLLLWFMVVNAQETATSKKVDNIQQTAIITYRIVHPLHEFESTSKEATAQIEFDETKKAITGVSAQVDVTSFDSGNSNRDSHAMEVIDALTYPDASFTSSNITQSNDSLSVTGKLTFHGVTKDITFGAVTSWSADTLKVKGAFTTTLTEFNIDRPSLLMIPVKDSLWFTLSAMFYMK